MKNIFLKNLLQFVRKVYRSFWQKISNRKLALLVLLVFLLLVVAIFLSSRRSQDYNLVASRGGTYREGVVGEIETLNPLFARSEAEKTISRLIYRNLFSYNKEGKISPDLVKNYEKNDNNTEYEIILKENLIWSDGSKIEANDIIETIRIISDDQYSGPFDGCLDDVKLEKIDQYKLKFKLESPDPLFPHRLTVPIMPYSYIENLEPEKLVLSLISRNPVSSGAYLFENIVNYSDRAQVTLIPNHNFENSADLANKKPYIQKLVLNSYSDYQMMYDAYQRKEVDGMSYVQPKDLANLNQDNIRELNLPQLTAVFFNNDDKRLKDYKLRKALSLAVDKREIVEDLLYGKAEIATGPLLDNKGDLKPNLEKAKEISDQLKLKNNRFRLVTSQDQTKIDVANKLKEFWLEIGIDVEIITYSNREIGDMIEREKDYDMLLFGHSLSLTDNLYPYWHSSQRDNGLNLANYKNQDVDFYLEQSIESSNLKERKKHIRKVSEQIKDDIPALFLYNPYYLHFVGENVKGFDKNIVITSSEDRMNSVDDWYILEKRKLKY